MNVTLGDLVSSKAIELRTGYSEGGHNEAGEGVPHIRPFNVSQDGRIDLSRIKWVPPPTPGSPLLLRPGDIIFNNTNSEELTGKTAYFDSDLPCTASNHMTIVRVTDDSVVDAFWLSSYLRYLFATGYFRSVLRRYVGQASVSLTRLREVAVPLPTLPEQRAIAHVLRTVEQAREATEQVIEAARELKRSLMQHLFSYGPVPPAESDVVELRETEFGLVSSEWDIMDLDSVALIQTGIALGGSKAAVGPLTSIPYLRVANVQDGLLDLTEIKKIEIPANQVERYRLRPGDVLLTEGGDIDKLGRGSIWAGEIDPCVHQNHVFAVRPDASVISPEYLAYLVQSTYAKRYFLKVGHRTTNLASINTTKLKAFPTILPPPLTQTKMVSHLSILDRKITAETQNREALDVVFSSVLSDLMSGRMRVPESLWGFAA